MTSDDDALGTLLEVERRIGQEIAAAQAEAERRVEAAREAARRLESDAEEPLDARVEAASYRDVDEATLRLLGERVVAHIMNLDPPT
jgi:vacuolar-type H+-ATPase subunit H